MSEEGFKVYPEDELIIKTIRSFSHRWTLLSQVLVGLKGVRNLGDLEAKSRTKLTTKHVKAVQELLSHLEDKALYARVLDFTPEDENMVSLFLRGQPNLTLDEVREMFQKKFVPPAPPEDPPETGGEASPEEENSLPPVEVVPKRELTPEEETDYRCLMSLLAIAQLRRNTVIHPNLLYPKQPVLVELIQSMRPAYEAEDVQGFVEYLKACAGKEFPWDPFDDDIPC